MKKLILGAMLALGTLGFSRYVEACRVISHRGGMTCVSRQSGKRFHFSSGYYNIYGTRIGSTYRVYFDGDGYSNLYLTDWDFLY